MEANNDKNKTKISQRIAEIKTKLCDGNNKKFAEMLGITEQYASNISNGTKYTGQKILDKILATFPQVSRTWLIQGEGQMLSTSTPASEDRAKAERSHDEPTIPLSAYTEVVRENERLRMEVEQLREKVALLSAETSEVVISASDTI